MELSTAEKLVSSSYDLRLYEDYSGRGMWGQSTSAVVGDRSDLMAAISSLIEEALYTTPDTEEIEEWKPLLRDLARLREDSLGLSTVFY